jgi:hypothetical protein
VAWLDRECPAKKQPFVGGAGTYEGRQGEGETPSRIADYRLPNFDPQPHLQGKLAVFACTRQDDAIRDMADYGVNTGIGQETAPPRIAI